MPLHIKIGQTVREIQPAPVEGVVTDAILDNGVIKYKVEWEDADGPQAHFYAEDAIEVVDDAPSAG